jgi:hypothetical protein
LRLQLLAERVYEFAADGGDDSQKLEVRGSDVAELASTFKEMLADAAEKSDFTAILCPNRSFFV